MRTYSFTDRAILEESCWPKVEACYSRTWDHYEMHPHFHNRAELMYVLKGWCLLHLFEYQMDSATQKIRITRQWTERMTADEFIFVDQGVLHALPHGPHGLFQPYQVVVVFFPQFHEKPLISQPKRPVM